MKVVPLLAAMVVSMPSGSCLPALSSRCWGSRHSPEILTHRTFRYRRSLSQP
jgi:hypothetical protein